MTYEQLKQELKQIIELSVRSPSAYRELTFRLLLEQLLESLPAETRTWVAQELATIDHTAKRMILPPNS